MVSSWWLVASNTVSGKGRWSEIQNFSQRTFFSTITLILVNILCFGSVRVTKYKNIAFGSCVWLPLVKWTYCHMLYFFIANIWSVRKRQKGDNWRENQKGICYLQGNSGHFTNLEPHLKKNRMVEPISTQGHTQTFWWTVANFKKMATWIFWLPYDDIFCSAQSENKSCFLWHIFQAFECIWHEMFNLLRSFTERLLGVWRISDHTTL